MWPALKNQTAGAMGDSTSALTRTTEYSAQTPHENLDASLTWLRPKNYHVGALVEELVTHRKNNTTVEQVPHWSLNPKREAVNCGFRLPRE